MQTFLPYENYVKSSKCLDRKRLGKQRVEAMQLLNTFSPNYNKKGWLNHPARIMWSKNILSLAAYGIVICNEWINRGYKDTCKEKIINILNQIYNTEYNEYKIYIQGISNTPSWLGLKKFHDSHKSNLLRKDYDHYSQFGWNIPNNLKYVWPSKNDL